MTDITQKVEDTQKQTRPPHVILPAHTHTHFQCCLERNRYAFVPSSVFDAHLTRADEMGMDDDDEMLGGRLRY